MTNQNNILYDNTAKADTLRFFPQFFEVRARLKTTEPKDYGPSLYEPQGMVAPPKIGGMRLAA